MQKASMVAVLLATVLLTACSAQPGPATSGPTASEETPIAVETTPADTPTSACRLNTQSGSFDCDGGATGHSAPPSATSDENSAVAGILLYPLRDGASNELSVSVYSPDTGQITETRNFDSSILSGDFHLHGHSRPAAYRALSPDLKLTYGYAGSSDGTNQLSVFTDDSQQVEVSDVLAQEDSFSGPLSAGQAFFRNDSLYFEMSNGSSAKQYSVSDAAILRGNLLASDFHRSDVDKNADGVSGADLTADLNTDCLQDNGRSWNAGLGFLANGRWLGLVNTEDTEQLFSFRSGCRADFTSRGGKSLLPATSRSIDQAVVSPDGRKIAFIASQQNVASLYTVGQDGGEPTKLADLPSARMILAGWR